MVIFWKSLSGGRHNHSERYIILLFAAIPKHGADATDDRVEQGGPIIAIIIREAMGDGDDDRRRGGRGTTTLVVVVVVVVVGGGGGGHPPLAAGPRCSP